MVPTAAFTMFLLRRLRVGGVGYSLHLLARTMSRLPHYGLCGVMLIWSSRVWPHPHTSTWHDARVAGDTVDRPPLFRWSLTSLSLTLCYIAGFLVKFDR